MQTGFSDCKENNLTVNNGKISIKLSMEKINFFSIHHLQTAKKKGMCINSKRKSK